MHSNFLRPMVVLLIATLSCAASTSEAQNRERDGTQWPSLDQGFLFVEGKYVPRPYEFRREGEHYFVNEINLASLGVDLSAYEEEVKTHQDRRDGKKRRGKSRDPISKFHWDLYSTIRFNDPVLLVSGLPPLWFGESTGGDLLRVLVDDEKRASAAKSVPDWKPIIPLKPTDSPRVMEYLSEWLASFRPSSTLLSNATARIEVLDTVEAANAQSSEATIRLATVGYPLTILMMVLVVLALGHLLSHRPTPLDRGGTLEPSGNAFPPELSVHFNRSLMLIDGLSAVDLIWTLLVSQAGAMHELNPIGSRMIDDPLELIVFKVLVTTAALGLLYFCRHVPLARQASWWGCLVLTLVASRWLIFNSMFIS